MDQSQNYQVEEVAVFQKFIQKMGENIFIADAETDEILFISQGFKELFGLEHPEGKPCWSVLQKDMKQRCHFCPIQFLDSDNLEKRSCVWKEKNTINGRIYENYVGFMNWKDGRVVHFQYSIDITDMKQLHDMVCIDELTGVLNRHTGKEQLKKVIQDSLEGKTQAVVAILDINDLKMINGTLGYHQGDQLVIRMTDIVKGELRSEDTFFRLKGDVFIVIFRNCSLQEASNRLEQALKKLSKRPLFPQLNRKQEFCYGLYELDGSVPLSAEQVLSKTDEALYLRKRSYHIGKSVAKLTEASVVLPAEQFSYDEKSLYEALVNSTDDYLYVCNMETGTFRYSQQMVDEFSLPGQVIENAAAVWETRIHENDKKRFLEANQDITDGRTSNHIVEYRALNRKGEWVWLRCRGRVICNEIGKAILFAGFITNLGKKNRFDSITGLYNKFEFESELEWYLENQKNRTAAVLLFGLDDFKRINTVYDYLFGDEVIRMTSQKIGSMLPPAAQLYRMDSDQFAMIFPHADKESVLDFFQVLQQQFNSWQIFDQKRFYCTLSCGCVLLKPEHSDCLTIIKEAGQALERAKFFGKNRIEFSSEENLPNLEHTLTMTELLRESIAHQYEEFSVQYQPVFTLNRRLMGAEALCRWNSNVYGSVRPDIFIGLLEESRLILQVGRWVFQQAAAFCKECLKVHKDFVMQINLSYLQLEDVTFVDFVKTTLKRLELNPQKIIFELTESYLAENLTRLTELLSPYRNLGIKLAMDDFGTGYSALGVLKSTPLDLVKIDRCFLRDIQNREFNSAFIRTVVELCHTIPTAVCLEGLETEQQYEQIRGTNIDYLQGFLLNKPLSEDDFRSRYLIT